MRVREIGYDPAEDIGVESELAMRLRLPLVRMAWPRWHYVSAVLVSPADHVAGWHGVLPTDAELHAIRSWHDEYVQHWYREGYLAILREQAPYDIDGGAAGRVLIKYEHGGWGYRIRTWTQGPTFWPLPDREPMSLVAVLDHQHGFGDEPNPRWEAWKAEHADVFAPVQDVTR